MAAQQGEDGTAETIRTLARVLSAVRPESFSPAAMRQAQLLLLDTIGCGIAGASEAVAQAAADVALRSGGKAQCALIGRAQKTDMLNAVLANGAAIRVLDLNDYLVGESKGQPETAGHPSDNIPVALAVGEARGCSGAAILESIVIGYELYARLQRLISQGGAWDAVTVSGLVAAAMAGRLFRLDEDRLAHALALGVARSATPAVVRSGHISAAKSLANALVAQAGVQAAMLAERGITGPLPILDHARGLRAVFSDADMAILTAPMPTDGAILRAHVKAYPCINTGQSAVAAALKLRALMSGNVEDIVRIDLIMADYAVTKRHQEDPGRLRPNSREAADHSFPFLVAATLLDGAFGLAQFEGERWQDPRVKALMERIVMSRDAGWNMRAPGAFPCTLRARIVGGRDIEAEIDYPPGFSRAGLDADAVTGKFHAVAAPHLDKPARDRIVDAIMEFHHSPSAAKLSAALAIQGTFT
jgi:2-methylcitrate dehydratase